jgi:glutamate-1-semialdehyde aminotransferase
VKPAEIRERAALLAGQPVRRPDARRLEREHEEFLDRTPRSRALHARGMLVLARGTEHVDPMAHPYPLFMSSGSGSTVVDVDGNAYVDCTLAGGAVLLGHNHPGLNARIMQIIRERTNFHGYLDEYEVLAAEKLCELFASVQAVRFTSSGAEANVAAMRIARAYTGRSKIIKFRGAYHGWSDQFMTDLEVPGSGTFLAGGVPAEFLSQTVLVHQNDLEELERALAGDDVAAVISEPLGAESGLVPFDDDYHIQAIDLAHRHGTLYVFDEVVTALRVGPGGAQRRFGVMPDLTTFGKGLMNGYPSCGAVGGRKELIDTANTGLPDHRPSTYIGGTLSGNVLSTAAAYHTLCEISAPGVQQRADEVATDLARRLNDLFEGRSTDYFAYQFGTIVRVELTAPQAVALRGPQALQDVLDRRQILGSYMLPVQNAGVQSRMGRDLITTAHSEADNQKVVAAYDRLLDLLD